VCGNSRYGKYDISLNCKSSSYSEYEKILTNDDRIKAEKIIDSHLSNIQKDSEDIDRFRTTLSHFCRS